MPKIDRTKIPFTNNASYPKEFAPVISGREKQKLGDAVGLMQFGVNIARIKAHSKSALRHWHTLEDEFVYVLDGEVVLVTNDSEQVLRAGDCGGYPAGNADAHHFVNRSHRPARYLEIGNRDPADEAFYPDDDIMYADGGDAYAHKDGTRY